MLDRRMLVRAAMAAPLACTLPVWARAATPPADSAAMARFIAGLPKAEFHVHLEGTLEAEMKFALARRNGLSRSEEHTSELQSLMRISYAVFCLKKKKKFKIYSNHNVYTTQTT